MGRTQVLVDLRSGALRIGETPVGTSRPRLTPDDAATWAADLYRLAVVLGDARAGQVLSGDLRARCEAARRSCRRWGPLPGIRHGTDGFIFRIGVRSADQPALAEALRASAMLPVAFPEVAA